MFWIKHRYIAAHKSMVLSLLTVAALFCSLLVVPLTASGKTCSAVMVNSTIKPANSATPNLNPKISKLGDELLINNDIHKESPVKIYKRTNGSLKYLHAIGGPLATRELDPRSLRNKRVLDVGTGVGATVRDLRKVDVEAEGVDMALSADQLKKPYFRQERAEQLSFEDQRFDLTISSFSLFYYPELQHVRVQALAEISRVTKSGGKILLIGFTGYSAKGEKLAQQGRGEDSNFLGFHREVDYMSRLWNRSARGLDTELSRLLTTVKDLEIDSVDYQYQVVLLRKK